MENDAAKAAAATERPGFAADCPCEKTDCPIWGDCVACVRGHREHQAHLPECMQPILRGLVEELARKVEYGVVERRPGH
ncbi:MAG: hypothetical protein HPY69_06360 [Armatimonadetes bacterium]|nr:hypothetical protein [Armatimonadota bacterium]